MDSLASESTGSYPPTGGRRFESFEFEILNKILYRGMEQLVARRAHNPKVVGSSPTPATTKKPVLPALFFYVHHIRFI